MLPQKSFSGDCFGWMGQDCGSWFPQQQFDLQSPNLNYPGSKLHFEQQNIVSSLINPVANKVSLNGALPGQAVPERELLHSQVVQANEPHRWFYCLPRFRQAFAPALNSVLKEKFPTAPYDNCKEDIGPRGESGCAQKRFLVFDQSGDQTTLIFSSGIETPVHCLTSWSPKPTGAFNLNKEELGSKENVNPHIGPNSNDESGENNENDPESEMHEDTAELNALLYSDDENDYSEDDEVTSTGHSPSTMTAHKKQDWFEGCTEQVASSDGATKKRKLFDGGYGDTPSTVDTASSVKPNRVIQYEDDAESRCANGISRASDEMSNKFCNKRMRKEKIHETVSILQDIIPGGKGKDAIAVLDEAIHYLKSLKLKAKALGLGVPVSGNMSACNTGS